MRIPSFFLASALAATVAYKMEPDDPGKRLKDFERDRGQPIPKPEPRFNAPADTSSWRESPKKMTKRQERRLRGKGQNRRIID